MNQVTWLAFQLALYRLRTHQLMQRHRVWIGR